MLASVPRFVAVCRYQVGVDIGYWRPNLFDEGVFTVAGPSPRLPFFGVATTMSAPEVVVGEGAGVSDKYIIALGVLIAVVLCSLLLGPGAKRGVEACFGGDPRKTTLVQRPGRGVAHLGHEHCIAILVCGTL